MGVLIQSDPMPLPPPMAPPTRSVGATTPLALRLAEKTNAWFLEQVEWRVQQDQESWGSTLATRDRFAVTMEPNTRKLIDHLASELAAIMEYTSVTAALLRGVAPHALDEAIGSLASAADQCQALASAMLALTQGRPSP